MLLILTGGLALKHVSAGTLVLEEAKGGVSLDIRSPAVSRLRVGIKSGWQS